MAFEKQDKLQPTSSSTIDVFDVTLRDGLMTHPMLSIETKKEYVDRMLRHGVRSFEVTRFPRADIYPQFDNGDALLSALQEYRPAARLSVFAVGGEGVDAALERHTMFDELHVPMFVSEAYAKYAFGTGRRDEQLEKLGSYCSSAARCGVRVTAGIGTVFGCPLAGPVPIQEVLAFIKAVRAVGVDSVMLGDTAGTAHPPLIAELLSAVQHDTLFREVRVHFHNTLGRALLSVWTALENGIRSIDASLLGLGGEPHPYFFAPDKVDNGNARLEEIMLLVQQFSAQGTMDNDLLETCRWFAGEVRQPLYSRAAFAQFVQVH